MEDKVIRLTLTMQEAAALKQLIHFAVQSKGLEVHNGLNVGEAGVVLGRKLDTAVSDIMAPPGAPRVSDTPLPPIPPIPSNGLDTDTASIKMPTPPRPVIHNETKASRKRN